MKEAQDIPSFESHDPLRNKLPVINQEMLFNVFSAVPAILAVIRSNDFTIEFANPLFEKFVGSVDIIGKPLHTVLSVIEPENLFTLIRQVFSTGESYIAQEMHFVFSNNTGKREYHCDVNFQKYYPNENSGESWLFLFLYDVTEKVIIRKQYLEANNILENNQRFLDDFFHHAPAFIGTATGENLLITRTNPQLNKLFENRKLLNETVEGALPELVENGMLESLKQVYQSGKPIVGTEQPLKLKKDGQLKNRLKYITFSCQPMFDPEYLKQGILVFGYDVTKIVWEKRKQMKNVKRIMETLPQITSISSGEGANIYFNRYFFKYSGLSKKEAAVNGWNSILEPQSRAAARKEWEEALKKGVEYSSELKFKRFSDQTYRWHKVQITPTKNHLGEIINWVASAVDIQEQKEKEEKKDEFISIASHELKTPLTTVKAYLQLIEAEGHSEEQTAAYAKRALLSVDRLNGLITELLEVSRLQQENFSLHKKSFDFSKMIHSAISEHRHTARHEIILKGDVVTDFFGDCDRLKQVVSNLINNAIKYSPGKDEIVVTVKNRKTRLEVCVQDFGIGISPLDSERIFERYYRVEGNSGNFQGLGIGLYISMQIVLKHGGKMWLTSEINKGSSFYFSLPLKN